MLYMYIQHYVASLNCPKCELNTDNIGKMTKVSSRQDCSDKQREMSLTGNKLLLAARRSGSNNKWSHHHYLDEKPSALFPFRSAARSTIKHWPSCCIKAQSVAISNSPLAAKAWFTMPFFYDVRSCVVLACGERFTWHFVCASLSLIGKCRSMKFPIQLLQGLPCTTCSTCML